MANSESIALRQTAAAASQLPSSTSPNAPTLTPTVLAPASATTLPPSELSASHMSNTSSLSSLSSTKVLSRKRKKSSDDHGSSSSSSSSASASSASAAATSANSSNEAVRSESGVGTSRVCMTLSEDIKVNEPHKLNSHISGPFSHVNGDVSVLPHLTANSNGSALAGTFSGGSTTVGPFQILIQPPASSSGASFFNPIIQPLLAPQLSSSNCLQPATNSSSTLLGNTAHHSLATAFYPAMLPFQVNAFSSAFGFNPQILSSVFYPALSQTVTAQTPTNISTNSTAAAASAQPSSTNSSLSIATATVRGAPTAAIYPFVAVSPFTSPSTMLAAGNAASAAATAAGNPFGSQMNSHPNITASTLANHQSLLTLLTPLVAAPGSPLPSANAAMNAALSTSPINLFSPALTQNNHNEHFQFADQLPASHNGGVLHSASLDIIQRDLTVLTAPTPTMPGDIADELCQGGMMIKEEDVDITRILLNEPLNAPNPSSQSPNASIGHQNPSGISATGNASAATRLFIDYPITHGPLTAIAFDKIFFVYDVMVYMMNFLPITDLVSACRVSRAWNYRLNPYHNPAVPPSLLLPTLQANVLDQSSPDEADEGKQDMSQKLSSPPADSNSPRAISLHHPESAQSSSPHTASPDLSLHHTTQAHQYSHSLTVSQPMPRNVTATSTALPSSSTSFSSLSPPNCGATSSSTLSLSSSSTSNSHSSSASSVSHSYSRPTWHQPYSAAPSWLSTQASDECDESKSDEVSIGAPNDIEVSDAASSCSPPLGGSKLRRTFSSPQRLTHFRNRENEVFYAMPNNLIRLQTLFQLLASLQRIEFLGSSPMQVTNFTLSLFSSFRGLRHASLCGCFNVTDSGLAVLSESTPQLEFIDLSHCSNITDSGIAHLARFCPKLQHVDLFTCELISDVALRFLSEGCKQLEYLKLAACRRISDIGCDYLGAGCKSLKILILTRCTRITDDGMRQLVSNSRCPLLQSLRLTYCSRVTDVGLSYLSRHANLVAIDLAGCEKITAEGFVHLSTCPKLEIIECTDCRGLDDSALKALQDCTHLKSLILSRCELFTGSGLQFLSKCKQLEILDLFACHRSSDSALSFLVSFNQLTSLDLADCSSITDQGIVVLANSCQRLKKLNLTRCSRLTDDGLQALSSCCHELQSLNLSYCSSITDVGLFHLSECRNLAHLTFYFCHKITDLGIMKVCGQTRRLVSLDVSGCSLISDAALARIASCSNLASLDLTSCSLVSDAGLAELSTCSSLVSLYLTECSRVGDSSIQEISQKCFQLKHLTLKGCILLTDAALLALSACRRLATLDLTDCEQITDDGILYLSGCTHLRNLILGNLPLVTAHGVIRLKERSPMLIHSINYP